MYNYLNKLQLLSLTILIVLISWECTAPQKESSEEESSEKKQTLQETQLLFNSGFEEGTKIVFKGGNTHNDDDEIIGKDLSVEEPNDWIADITDNPLLGDITIGYQGGDTTMRKAQIIDDPTQANNKVLQFWADTANVSGRKMRTQINIFEKSNQNMPGIYELYQSVKLYLPNQMALLHNFPDTINWLTIYEVWNNIQWVDDPYPFRITVGIGKPSGKPDSLHFMVDAQDFEYASDKMIQNHGKYINIWEEMNMDINVPIGKWFTLEYYVKEGNDKTGRFLMTVQPEGEEKKVVFDINNFTHNTKDPAPDGITLWNPIKMYTSKYVANYMGENNAALEILWDDFEVWKNKLPEIK